jgi:hypothetical protein
MLQEIMAKEVELCTFRPETTKNKKYDNVKSVYGDADEHSMLMA